MSSNVQNVMNSQVTNQNISNISNNLSGGGTGGGGDVVPRPINETANKANELSKSINNDRF